MNILILHQMGNPKRWIKAVADLELALVNNDSTNNYIVHNSILRFPEFLKDYPFDGIILNSTFLDARHQKSRLERILNEYAFIKNSSAVKIALAQDDYDCNIELDNWMVDWDVDYFYSVVHQYSKDLFPRYFKAKGPILKGYTGYLTTEQVNRAIRVKKHESRKIDVGYRATDIVTNLNKLVILKAQIGRRFVEKFQPYGLNLDISTRNEDRIYGDSWFSFVEDCRFMIGTNSGSSLIIPNLSLRESVQAYISANPDWNYSDVKSLFFPEQDESTSYTAISPRNLEAAVLGTCQINTTLGDYSGLLTPWEQFIPLSEDCSNHEEVFEAMKDSKLVNQILERAKESILSFDDLRLMNFVDDLLFKIESRTNSFNDNRLLKFSELSSKYQSHIRPLEKIQWTKDSIKDKIKGLIKYRTKGTRVN